MVVAGTGHRPNKLAPNADAYWAEVHPRLIEFMRQILREVRPTKAISGMAAGFDMAMAAAALHEGIPLICAIPFKAQYEGYSRNVRSMYLQIFEAASKKILVSREFDHGCFQRRNIWMVDRCQLVLGLWNGTDGGTANCIEYARKRQVSVDDLWERWLAFDPSAESEFF